MGPGISYRDWVKRAESGGQLELSLTSGTSVLPLENAQSMVLREAASFTSSVVFFRLDFNSAVLEENQWTGEDGITVGCVGLFNIEAGNGGSFRVKVYADDDNTTPVMNKEFIVLAAPNFNLEYGQVNLLLIFDQVYENVQRVDIEVYATATISKLGRLWIGNWMETCFDAEWDISPDTQSKVNYSTGIDAHPVFSRRSRKGIFPFSEIPYEQAFGTQNDAFLNNISTFNDLFQTAGKDSEIVVQPRPTAFDSTYQFALPTTFYGLITKDSSMPHIGGNLFETKISAKELI